MCSSPATQSMTMAVSTSCSDRCRPAVAATRLVRRLACSMVTPGACGVGCSFSMPRIVSRGARSRHLQIPAWRISNLEESRI